MVIVVEADIIRLGLDEGTRKAFSSGSSSSSTKSTDL